MSQFPFAGQTPAPFQQAPQFAPGPQYPQAPQFPGVPAAPNPYAQQFPTPPAYPQAPAPFGQQYGQPFYPQAPAQPLPQGDLAAFYGQPKTGRPAAVSWKGAPDGYTIAGVVAEDVTDKDVVPDTDPQTRQLKTFRDGSPKYALAVTLRVQPSQANPEGLATLYCRGDLWDKMDAAMKAAGRHGAPKAGDVLYVSLVERRQGRGTVPRNIFAVQYALGGAPDAAPTAPQAPEQPAPQVQAPAFTPTAPEPVQAPVQQFAPQAPAQPLPQQGAQPGVQFQAPAPQPPAQQFAPPVPQQAPVQQFAPQAPAGMPAPGQLAGQMTPEQLALLAQLKGQA